MPLQDERPVSISEALEEASQAVRSKRAQLVRVVPAEPRCRGASAAAEPAAAPADDAAPGSAAEAAAAGISGDPERDMSELHVPEPAANPQDSSAADSDDMVLELMAQLDADPTPDAHASPPAAGAAACPEPGWPDISVPSAAAGKKRRWSVSRKQQQAKQRRAAAQTKTNVSVPPDMAGERDDGLAHSADAPPVPAEPVTGTASPDSPLRSPQRQKRVRKAPQPAKQPRKKRKGRRCTGPEQQSPTQDIGAKAGGDLSLAELEQLTSEVMDQNEQATASGK